MKRILALILVLSLFAPMISAGMLGPSTQKTINPRLTLGLDTISGFVLDPNTFQGVEGATVVVTTTAPGYVGITTTDASGHFSIELFTPGVYSFTISAEGYDTKTITRFVPKGAGVLLWF